MSRRNPRMRKLNPAFAAAHGIQTEALPEGNTGSAGASSPQPGNTAKKVSLAITRAQESGKLNVANVGLTSPLPESLFDFRSTIDVNLSLDGSSTPSWNLHAEETLTNVDFSDNAIGGTLDPRIARYAAINVLRCRRTQIESFPVNLLQGMQLLGTLDLAGNQLSSFSLDLLPPSISQVDLSNNRLETLLHDSNSTVNLANLSQLDVSHNKLRQIPTSLQAQNLRILRCGNNQLEDLPTAVLKLSSRTLTTLEAPKNGISNPPDFSALVALRNLDLSNNKLSVPPPVHLSLVELSLDNNKLKGIDGLFSASSDLSEKSQLADLLLHGNQIAELSEDVVKRLVNIRILDLRNNNLRTLPPVIGHLPAVRQILLEGNAIRTLGSVDQTDTPAVLAALRRRGGSVRITAVGGPSVDGKVVEDNLAPQKIQSGLLSRCLVEPKTLDLQKKELTELPADLLSELQSLPTVTNRVTRLLVSRNKLNSIDEGWLKLLINLSVFEGDKNRLSQIPTSISGLRLKSLSLQMNMLTTESIQQGALGNHLETSLQHLDLSSNRLEKIPPVLIRLKSLHTLRLSANRISDGGGWSPGLPLLATLDLSSNKIHSLGDLPFILAAHNPNLKTLLLQNNELKAVPPELGLVNTLQHLDLQGNPQRSIRTVILDKPCAILLEYLSSRMTPKQLEEAIAKRDFYGAVQVDQSLSATQKGGEPIPQIPKEAEKPTSIQHMPPSQPCQVSQPTTNNDEPVMNERAGSDATKKSAPAVKVVESTLQDGVPTSEVAEQLRAEIDSLSKQLGSVGISQAKKYALKKQLAMQRSKLIREERRLKQGH